MEQRNTQAPQVGVSRGSVEFLTDWGDALTRWTERWIPDALVIVIILSFVAYIFALIWGFKPEVALVTRAHKSILAWAQGFWSLLEFAMQMCLIMMTGYILACSAPVRKLMNGLSGLSNPDKPYQAIVTMALFSMIIAWLNWGLSLIPKIKGTGAHGKEKFRNMQIACRSYAYEHGTDIPEVVGWRWPF